MHQILLATRYNAWDQIQGVLIGAAGFAILIAFPILAIWLLRKRRTASTPAVIAPGSVRFVFHTYSGFLLWVKQRAYDRVMTIDDAEALLKRFVRHNLTWGLFVYGGPFVPIFTLIEWRSQKKRIVAARYVSPRSPARPG